MSEKRFDATWNMHRGLHYSAIEDTISKKMYCIEQYHTDVEKVVDLLNKLYEENEQLRTQLAICQQSQNDDGRFQVWEVPPIPKETSITFSTTTERSD